MYHRQCRCNPPCSISLDSEAALPEKRVHSSNPALPALSIESGREISDIVLYVELSLSFILGGSMTARNGLEPPKRAGLVVLL